MEDNADLDPLVQATELEQALKRLVEGAVSLDDVVRRAASAP
jgi:hypothetical protein